MKGGVTMADTPITREEKYLAYLTGDYKADIPKPITRQERYLYELCLKGMGGGTGEQGPKGDKGTTFVPSVDSDGNLSWSNTDGLDNPETVNVKGPKGDKGENGSDATVPIATVEILGKVKPDGKTTFIDEDGTLHAKGGGATVTPKPVNNPSIENANASVVIKWQDPENTVINGSTFSTWAGTKLVMKESGYPANPDDGTLVVDNTTRDKYKTTGYTVTGLTNGKKYYFALFPYFFCERRRTVSVFQKCYC